MIKPGPMQAPRHADAGAAFLVQKAQQQRSVLHPWRCFWKNPEICRLPTEIMLISNKSILQNRPLKSASVTDAVGSARVCHFSSCLIFTSTLLTSTPSSAGMSMYFLPSIIFVSTR